MEPEGSLPCSKQPLTGRGPESDKSSPDLQTLLKIHFNINRPYSGSIQKFPDWADNEI
jgi:hypothetical protein